MRNVATILPLKFKLSGKFQRFNTIDRSVEMLKTVEHQNISIKMNNFKIFYEPHTASILSLEQKLFIRRYTGIHKYLLSKCLKNAILGRLEMVQCKYFF